MKFGPRAELWAAKGIFRPFSLLPLKSHSSALDENFKKHLYENISIAARVQRTKFGNNRPSSLF